MPTFSLLADPDKYIPCSTENMLVDVEYREYWLAHFEKHFNVIMNLARAHYGPEAEPRILEAQEDLVDSLHMLKKSPKKFGMLDLLILDMMRQEILISHDIPDPFETMKRKENEAMLPLYPGVVAELDHHTDPKEALLLATEGVFAGNIYDLGAGATSERFAKESPDFLKVRGEVGAARPWLVDQFDAMAARLLGDNAPKQVMFFCDNAGSDCILGVIPFCRLLAKWGMRVLIAANHLPALNDMTCAELKAFLPKLQAIDPVLDALVKSGRIVVIDSGGPAPLIDLRMVTEEVNSYAATADLVILEGMGRALESNYEAKFSVDSVKLAMIKEEIVARKHGGKLYDTVCRFDKAAPAVVRPAPKNHTGLGLEE